MDLCKKKLFFPQIFSLDRSPGGGTLGISGWGCATGLVLLKIIKEIKGDVKNQP